MDINNIQALIAQGLLTDVASVDPNTAYVAVGVYQPGNRQSGPAGNAYPSYAMPISEFLAAGGIYTASNGIALVGNDFQLASLNISQFTNDANYVTGTGTIGYVPRWDLTDALGNSVIFDDGLGNVGIGTITPAAKLHIKGVNVVNTDFALKVDNSFPSPLLYVRNDGRIEFGNTSGADYLYFDPLAVEFQVTLGNQSMGIATDTFGMYDSYNYVQSGDSGGGSSLALGITNKFYVREYTSGTSLFNITGNGVSTFNAPTPYATNFGYDVKWQAFANPVSSDGNYISLCSGGGAIFNATFSRRNSGVVKSEMYFIESNDTTYMAIGVIGDANKGFALRTNDTDRLHISHTGNVGIGTTPTARLQVQGVDATATNYALKVDNSASSPLFYVTNNGNAGIGSIPTAKLDVRGQTISGNGTGLVTNNDSPFYAVRANTGNPNYYTGWQYAFEVGGGIWGIGMNYSNNEYQFLTNGSSTAKFVFGVGNPSNPLSKFTMDLNGGYFGANVTPTATMHGKGIDSTSSNYALKIDNSASSPLLYVRNDGLLTAPLLPTSNAGLSTGDMYVDTAANILANGDKVVGWKV